MRNPKFDRKVRSYVRRDGRMTAMQKLAYQECWPQFGLAPEQPNKDWERVFQRKAPCVLEIGFGSGQSLLTMAQMHPEVNFIGIEMHLPGIGALLLGMQRRKINNIRIYYADAVEVLNSCVPESSLDGIQIFFPDPWPKRRHHKRRLIQPVFIDTVVNRLKPGGYLHLATDWQDYAEQMLRILMNNPNLINLENTQQYSNRSEKRPIITKFEQRGLRNGRKIYELQFEKGNESGDNGR